MSKSNGPSEGRPKTRTAITSLSVAGFKSIVKAQTLEIRPLTLLAGANSSGKSSMMQPLLLLKQTLEAPFDPGPLLLDGPNVRFTSARQFRPAGSSRGRAVPFLVWLEMSDETSFIATFRGYENKPIELASNAIIKNGHKIFIDHALKFDDLALLTTDLSPALLQRIKTQLGETSLGILRDRFFVRLDNTRAPEFFYVMLQYYTYISIISNLIMEAIHVPGLRGNPRRMYSVTAVDAAYPGTFDNYVASLIAYWGSQSPDRVSQLSDDLKLLGLTWKIEANRINDTQVELRVGRMPHPRHGGAKDLVSIADVGFGVSQTLPVAMALRAAQPGQLVYIEQPEIHLHPRAQVAMARLLVNAAKRGARVVAETHSSLILLAVQTLVAEGVIDPGLVGLNWFLRDEKDGTTRIKTAELDEAGRFGDWPEDLDEVALEAENRYLSAAEDRLAKG
jgi:hypothetical protein